MLKSPSSLAYAPCFYVNFMIYFKSTLSIPYTWPRSLWDTILSLIYLGGDTGSDF